MVHKELCPSRTDLHWKLGARTGNMHSQGACQTPLGTNMSTNPVHAAQTSDEVLLVDTSDGVTRLTLNRPKAFNALSESLLGALQSAIDGIDDQTRVVVLRANGKAFCAGHDLKEMRAHPQKPYYDALFKRCSRVMQSLLALPQPVIAEVQGMATAAGCQLVANCDLAIASSEARFAVSGINVGLFCSTPAKSAVAVSTGKSMFYQQIELPLEQAYQLAGETMACNMMAEDVGEGIDAFIGKRKAEWKHR